MSLEGKSSQEYPVTVGVPQGFILGFIFFLLYLNGFPGDVICDIPIYDDDTNLSSISVIRHLICGNNLNCQLGKWLVDFNAGKTQLVSFDQSSNNGSTDVKIGWVCS